MSGGEVTGTLSIARSSDGQGVRVAVPGLVVLFSEPRAPAGRRPGRRAGAPRVDQPTLPAPHALRGPTRVGRDPGADLCLPDQAVSRLHAIIEPREDGVWVQDQGSHNGCGALLPQPGSQLLSYVDIPTALEVAFDCVLRLGNTLLWTTRDVGAFQEPGHGLTLLGGPWLRQLISPLAGTLQADEPVLLEGETGTGKERMAHELHVLSRRQGPFVAINCAALPTELVEAELFGHTSGAFSGSKQSRLGLFRSADQGTLLLDEIGELPRQAQSKLLRVLEEHAVRPVGQDRAEPIDVRVIAATNRDLNQMCAAGLFREDLFHRISVGRMRLPALRERRYDIPKLAQHFLDGLKLEQPPDISVAAMQQLMSRAWPGNARELRNVVRAASLEARAVGRAQISPDELGAPPVSERSPAPQRWLADAPGAPSLAAGDLERQRLITALQLCRGNVTEVARRMNTRRARLYELFNRYQLDPEVFRKDK